jgi:hypothetical protein
LGWCPRPQGVAPGWFVAAPFGAQKARIEDIPGFCQEDLLDPQWQRNLSDLASARTL